MFADAKLWFFSALCSLFTSKMFTFVFFSEKGKGINQLINIYK